MSEMREEARVPEWTLGWRLQRALAYADMGVEAMAAELGVSRGTLSRWMNDRGAAPKAAYVKMWSLRTGVPYVWLRDGLAPGQDGPQGGKRHQSTTAR